MPRNRKNPPHQRAQNGLAYGERDDVAFSRKEPAHRGATDKSQWDKNRVGPVQGGKNGASYESDRARLLQSIKEPVRQIRIQGDLLQQTKRKVSEEAPGF